MERLVLVILGTAGIVSAVAVIWKQAILPITHLVEEVKDFLGDWKGEPERPGVPGRMGVLERLEEHDNELQAIRAEVRPNDGGSLRDAVNRTEGKVNEVNERLDLIYDSHHELAESHWEEVKASRKDREMLMRALRKNHPEDFGEYPGYQEET